MFTAIGTRIKKGYDSLIPKEGVEIYVVDQSDTACSNPTWGVCWGVERRTQPFPVMDGNPTAHVLGLHETAEIEDGVLVTVLERSGDS